MSVLCAGTQTGQDHLYNTELHAASVSLPSSFASTNAVVSWEAEQELGPHADGQDLDNNPSLETMSPKNNIIIKEKVLILLSDSHI